MPLPEPGTDEGEQDFLSRCMSELADEFPDESQRRAVCQSQWEGDKDMEPIRKAYTLTNLKLDSQGEGTFEAAFANLRAIDHEGDGFDPGAIGNQKVKLSVWNHGSWGNGAEALPIGVGETSERDGWAVISGKFDLGRQSGREHYQAIKYFNAEGHSVEWSFALPDADWRMEERDGQMIRIFTRIKIPEVSPVLLGAGVDTHLLSIKGSSVFSDVLSVPEKMGTDDMKRQQDALSRELGRTVLTMPSEDGTKTLFYVVAEPSEREVDSESSESKEKDMDSESKRFVDHLDETVETVERVISRAEKVKALRDGEGRPMSGRSMRRIKILQDALHDAVDRIDGVLADPGDELKELHAKFREGTKDAS